MNDSYNGNPIIKTLDTIGFIGPFILLTIGIWQLWNNAGFWKGRAGNDDGIVKEVL